MLFMFLCILAGFIATCLGYYVGYKASSDTWASRDNGKPINHAGRTFYVVDEADYRDMIDSINNFEKEAYAHMTAICERDYAEETLSQAYRSVTGFIPEWSNNFGYEEALDDIYTHMNKKRAAMTSN